jgi:amino acid transporter
VEGIVLLSEGVEGLDQFLVGDHIGWREDSRPANHDLAKTHRHAKDATSLVCGGCHQSVTWRNVTDEQLATTLHRRPVRDPRTLLAHDNFGEAISDRNGAPLRLATPLKDGIEQIKRRGMVQFLREQGGDYWGERGYDWYAGLKPPCRDQGPGRGQGGSGTLFTVTSVNEHDGLRPAIGARLLYLMVVGDILGAGIYILVGDVAGELGGMAWLAFGTAFGIAALSAAAYAELTTRFPGAAGSALYVDRAAGIPALTFAVGMAVMLSSLMTAATTARAFAGDYLAEFVDAPVVLVAVGVVATLTALNLRGIESTANANVVMTIIEIVGLLVVLVIGTAAIADGGGDASRLVDTSNLAIGGWLSATALAFFAFLGFEDAAHLSEEVHDPRKTFPPVLFAAVATASALYLAVTIVSTVAVDPAVLAASDGPLLEVASTGPLGVPTRWYALVALVAVTNTCLFALVASSRLLYGMAVDGHVPTTFSRLLPARRTPVVASLAMAVIAAGMVATGAVSDLAEAAVTLLLAVLVVVNIAAVATRHTPEAEHAYRAPTWMAPLGAVACAVLLVHQLATASAADLVRLALLLAVSGVLWLAARVQRR